MSQNLSSAAVMIGALRDNEASSLSMFQMLEKGTCLLNCFKDFHIYFVISRGFSV